MSDQFKLAREIGALVIIHTDGPTYHRGEYHPGYFFAKEYGELYLTEPATQKLMSLIPELRKGTNSSEYTHNADGTVLIQFEVDGTKYELKGKWV